MAKPSGVTQEEWNELLKAYKELQEALYASRIDKNGNPIPKEKKVELKDFNLGEYIEKKTTKKKSVKKVDSTRKPWWRIV